METTEYRINGGEFHPYTGPVKSIAFSIATPDNCTPNRNDEFDGPALDSKWQIVRDAPGARSFVDGRLRMLVRAGDMIGGTATAQNLLLQNAGPITDVGDPSAMKVGIKISDNADSDHYAGFDFFRMDCSDRIAPTTTASLAPATADGKLGWYTSAPP